MIEQAFGFLNNDIKAKELGHSCRVEKAEAVRDTCLEQIPGAAEAAAAEMPGGH